jgi:hypothetical protein
MAYSNKLNFANFTLTQDPETRVSATVVSLVHDAVLFWQGAGSLMQHAIGGLFLYKSCLNRYN